MQFRIVIQCESEEANALALDYLFLGIGSLTGILIYGRSFARLHHKDGDFRRGGGREGVFIIVRRKKTGDAAAASFWDYKKTASRRNLFSLSFSLGVPFE